MSKTLKVAILITFIISILFTILPVVKATSEATTISEEVIDDTTQPSMMDTLSPSTVTSVSTMNNYSQANLELNNVLSIILISIGVLLILLAIAILIRLKK